MSAIGCVLVATVLAGSKIVTIDGLRMVAKGSPFKVYRCSKVLNQRLS